jgi:hypothetical protein
MGKMRNTYCTLVGKPEGKRLLGRPRHSWEDNIRMGLREIGWWEGVDWMPLVQDREQSVAGPCEYGHDPLGSTKGRDFLD